MRERRFTSDVTHELRNPLAGIRSTIEVKLTHTRDITEYKSALSECLEIVEKMQTMSITCCCSHGWMLNK